MKMSPIDSFEIPELGYTFVDFQNCERDDRYEALEIMRALLQGILDDVRPGVTLCQSSSVQIDGCNPALGIANFVVYEGDDIRGAFNIYNVKEEGGLVAMAAPGTLGADGFSVAETWAIVMRWMLENVIEAWEFPDIQGQEWKDDARADAVVAELTDAGHTIELYEDGTPSRADRAS